MKLESLSLPTWAHSLMQHPKWIYYRKSLFVLIGMYGLTVLVLLYGQSSLTAWSESMMNDIQRSQANSQLIASEIAEERKKAAWQSKIEKTWKNVSSLPRKGLQLDRLQSIKEDLIARYRMKDTVELRISSPKEVALSENHERILWVKSDMHLRYDAIDDLRALAFLEDFLAAVPGRIVISQWQMRRLVKNLNDDTVEKIVQNNFRALVSVEIDAEWWDILDKTEKTPEKIPGAKP